MSPSYIVPHKYHDTESSSKHFCTSTRPHQCLISVVISITPLKSLEKEQALRLSY